MHEGWLQRWEQNNIGFHRVEVHPALPAHWRPRAGSVLVPLCGKSLDLRWLAEHGHEVVGVELAGRAIHDFFREQRLTFERRDGALPVYVARELPIEIHHGDYFRFAGRRCDALYDRAALVALPPEQRASYARHTDSLLRAGAFRLVVTLEYEQSMVQGPPFSVPAAELGALWPGLTPVARQDAHGDVPPRFRAAGAFLVEVVWCSAPGGVAMAD